MLVRTRVTRRSEEFPQQDRIETSEVGFSRGRVDSWGGQVTRANWLEGAARNFQEGACVNYTVHEA